MKKFFYVGFSVVILLSGCLEVKHVKETFSPDGHPAYIVDCSFDEMDCLKRAGDACQGHGYNVINKSNGKYDSHFLIECKQQSKTSSNPVKDQLADALEFRGLVLQDTISTCNNGPFSSRNYDYTEENKKYVDEIANARDYERVAWEKAAQQQEQKMDSMFIDNAQLILGIEYAMGYGVPKNLETAFKWLKKSAEEHGRNSIAQFNLGVMYAKGLGVKKNDTEAVRWFQDTIKNYPINGYEILALAKNNLGYMYANGFGVAKDVTKATKFFTEAKQDCEFIELINHNVDIMNKVTW